ncbi:hypothetical protein PTKIN_Ptkin03bG0254700 [Pterospermum kingtungense]
MVAYEILYSMKNKRAGKTGQVGIKLDMAKAYDRLEWCYIIAVRRSMGFSERRVRLVWHCISSVSYSVVINSRRSPGFQPSSEIQQGDPLSPILFILGVEGLSSVLLHFERTGFWWGDTVDQMRINWCAWDTLCSSKLDGGILREKYFSHSNPMKVSLSPRSSYLQVCQAPSLVNLAVRLCSEYAIMLNRESIPIVENDSGDFLPGMGVIRVNVDAGFRSLTSEACLGVVICDSSGVNLLSTSKTITHVSSSFLAELYAISYGVELAKRNCYDHVQIQSDCLQAVSELDRTDGIMCEGGSVIADIHNSAAHFDSFSFSFI